MHKLPPRSSDSDAEMIAINALRFLAGRPEELGRFMALSGIDPADLRGLAGDTDFLGGVLDFLLSDEALLLVFAQDADLAPNAIAGARHLLERGRRPLGSDED
jgi:hypothetical protein